MLKAIRFEILRNLEVKMGAPSPSIPLAEKPVRVATLINEAAFNKDHHLEHLRTVFLEDFMHDWNWSDGQFRYYSRVGEKADVVIVYEEAQVTSRPKFDPMTGLPITGKF